MFVIEGRPIVNIAIITITGLMAKNKRFCPGLKEKGNCVCFQRKDEKFAGKRDKMRKDLWLCE